MLAEVDSNNGCHNHNVCFTDTKTVWLYIKTQENELSWHIAYNDYSLVGQLIQLKVGLYNSSKYSVSNCTALCLYIYTKLSAISLKFFFLLQKHSIRLTATNTYQQWYTVYEHVFKGLNFMINRNLFCKNV